MITCFLVLLVFETLTYITSFHFFKNILLFIFIFLSEVLQLWFICRIRSVIILMFYDEKLWLLFVN